MDKYELARLSPHPPPADSSTPKVMIRILPYLVAMRLFFASFVFSNSDIFKVGESLYFQAYRKQYESLGLFKGVASEASIYHFVALAVLVVLLLLKTFVWPFVEGFYHVLEETLESLACCCKCCKHRLGTSKNRVGKSAFTEYHCERWDKDFSPITTAMCLKKPKLHKLRKKNSEK